MAISASQIVQVNPRLLKPGGKDLELNGLILSENITIPINTILAFSDPESVSSYFGSTATETNMAQIYFLGYNNSFVKPRVLYFYRYINVAASPFTRGGTNTSTVSEIKAISTGTLTVQLGAISKELTGIDFSSITSFSDAAVIVQAAVRTNTDGGDSWTNATCTYSSQFNAFVITGGETGTSATIGFCSGTVADALFLTASSGAILSQGSDIVTPTMTMDNILLQTQNWVTFTTSWKPSEEEVLGFGSWTSNKGVGYLFVYYDNDPNLLTNGSTSTIASAIKTANLGSIVGEWFNYQYAAFVLGIGASIDFNREQGAITTAFKSQEGLQANVTNSTSALNLISNGMNFYGDYASRNDNFVFHYPGQMFGKYQWIDTYLNAVWFYNAIQAALMAGLTTAQRVPYTESGYTLVRAWLQEPVNRALKNGVIDPGVVLSELQKSQVNREAGLDIATYIEQSGYYIQVLDPGTNARLTRDSATVNLWYTYGGSIQRLEVAATALV